MDMEKNKSLKLKLDKIGKQFAYILKTLVANIVKHRTHFNTQFNQLQISIVRLGTVAHLAGNHLLLAANPDQLRHQFTATFLGDVKIILLKLNNIYISLLFLFSKLTRLRGFTYLNCDDLVVRLTHFVHVRKLFIETVRIVILLMNHILGHVLVRIHIVPQDRNQGLLLRKCR